MIFNKLEPADIWSYFYEICKIPRLSKNENEIRNYLLDFAKKHRLKSKTDAVGNVLISKEADKAFENNKSVVLQSHMDMVGEKNAETEHDWEKDPISPVIDGEWIKAKNTTLGADDGIGIAAQLALLANEEIKTGAIECLFTVDEETGMTGAIELEAGFFDSRILINLDSEDEGELFIGCAGGIDTIASFNYKKESIPENAAAIDISITGLQGGHSGDEIHKGFGNSVKILSQLYFKLIESFTIRLAHLDGGNLRNAIPREAFVTFICDKSSCTEIIDSINDFHLSLKAEMSDIEPDLSIKSMIVDLPGQIIDQETQSSLFMAINDCPHGVIGWSEDMPGLVETSSNLASVKFKEADTIIITTSQRSSVETAKHDIANRIESIFKNTGAHVKHSDGYPGWKPNLDSEILSICELSYKKLFSEQPLVRAIHAGLECGLILEKFPGLDMISFGPTIKGAHTPNERINIKTTQKFWDLLLDVLQNVPKK